MAKKKDTGHAARAHALLSASSSERWMMCPASASLNERYPREDTAFTLEGTAAHEVAEVCARRLVLGEDISLEDITEADPEKFNDEMWRHGQAYAEYIAEHCTPDTTIMLEQRVDFSKWVPEGFGTADCILLTGDTMDVIDYKYGQGVEVSADNNSQMQLYGLGALCEYGFVYEVKNVRLHIFQPRKDNISMWETTAEHLELFGKWAKKCAEEALGDNPRMCAGMHHCKFCKHAGHCPELARTCFEVASQGDTLAPDPLSMTPEAMAYVLAADAMIKAWLKAVNAAALTDMQNGKEIPGFKVVEGKLGNRKWTDEQKVIDKLEKDTDLEEIDIYNLTLKSPADFDKLLGKKKAAELLGKFISRAPGAPTIVPETDKRPKLDRAAQAKDDFKEEANA